jgi:hypothetical protein
MAAEASEWKQIEDPEKVWFDFLRDTLIQAGKKAQNTGELVEFHCTEYQEKPEDPEESEKPGESEEKSEKPQGCPVVIRAKSRSRGRVSFQITSNAACLYDALDAPPRSEMVTVLDKQYEATSISPENALKIAQTAKNVIEKDQKKGSLAQLLSPSKAWPEIQKALRALEKKEEREEELLGENQTLVVIWAGQQNADPLVGNVPGIHVNDIAYAADTMSLYDNPGNQFYVVSLDRGENK